MDEEQVLHDPGHATHPLLESKNYEAEHVTGLSTNF